jgi:hypothetical protein
MLQSDSGAGTEPSISSLPQTEYDALGNLKVGHEEDFTALGLTRDVCQSLPEER